MREIILDTETTGLDPAGDRIVEIGCLEILNGIPTGQTFHVYLNPQRDMPEGALAVHGLSKTFLADKPLFALVAKDLLGFIGEGRLVIHNAEFDIRFLNAELMRSGLPPIGIDRVVDTLQLARRKHPGGPNSLDALCQRYRIDNSRRSRHGALLDAEILSEIYAELTGGRQAALGLEANGVAMRRFACHRNGARPQPLPSRLSEMEVAAHAEFVASLGAKAIWLTFFNQQPKPVA